jgi:hypothetical protein
MTKLRQQNWLLLPLLCLCAALYYPGLHGPILLDDFPQLEGLMNQSGQNIGYLLQEFLFSTSGPLGRPVAMFSFILDASLWGNQLWHWKMTNAALHLATVLAVYWLICALLHTSSYPSKQKFWIAFFVSSVWALHPLHASTVLYTVQRMTILSALFSLLSMASYLEGRYRLQHQIAGGYRWIILSLAVFFPLSAFSKENGLLIPLYLMLIEWICFPESRLHQAWNRLTEKGKWLWIGALLLGLGIGLWLFIEYFIGTSYTTRPFTLQERLLTESRVMIMYLWQVLAPSWSNLGFFHDDIRVSTGLLTPISTLFSLLLLAGLGVLGIALRKRNPFAYFGILLFFASHLMESTIIPLELMFEHRNYLGSVGIILAITAIISRHIVSTRTFAITGSIIVTALAVVLLLFTYTWGDKERLDTQLYAAHPDSPSAIAAMADRYVDAWSPHLAWELLDRSERAGYKLQSLVIKCRLAHRLEDADLHNLNARMNSLILPYELTGLIELSNQRLDDQCTFSDKLFQQTLAQALNHTVDHLAKQKLRVYKAYFIHKSGNLENALAELEQGYKAAPSSPMPLFLATEWLLDSGDKARARQYYQRALAASDENKAITAEYRSHFQDRIAP